MPLTGDAKREYQRVYMRQTRRAMAAAKKKVKALTGEVLRGAALVSAGGNGAAQEVLRGQLDQQGLDLSKIVSKVAQKLEAERPYGKDAINGPDNDAQLRACDIALNLHERAGTIPAIAEHGSGGTHITVVEVLYCPTSGGEVAEQSAIEAQVLDSTR